MWQAAKACSWRCITASCVRACCAPDACDEAERHTQLRQKCTRSYGRDADAAATAGSLLIMTGTCHAPHDMLLLVTPHTCCSNSLLSLRIANKARAHKRAAF